MASNPTPPEANIYSTEEWQRGPSNPDSIGPAPHWYVVEPGEMLSDVAKAGGLSLPALGRYNWGTGRVNEILWYLQRDVDAIRIRPGDKVQFTGWGQGARQRGGLWVPALHPPTRHSAKGGTALRHQTTTLDVVRCLHLKRSECTAEQDESGGHPKCEPPPPP
jgi:hypothetical protein